MNRTMYVQYFHYVVRYKNIGAHVVKIRGREYVRDNPDSSTRDNVNRNE